MKIHKTALGLAVIASAAVGLLAACATGGNSSNGPSAATSLVPISGGVDGVAVGLDDGAGGMVLYSPNPATPTVIEVRQAGSLTTFATGLVHVEAVDVKAEVLAVLGVYDNAGVLEGRIQFYKDTNADGLVGPLDLTATIAMSPSEVAPVLAFKDWAVAYDFGANDLVTLTDTNADNVPDAQSVFHADVLLTPGLGATSVGIEDHPTDNVAIVRNAWEFKRITDTDRDGVADEVADLR